MVERGFFSAFHPPPPVLFFLFLERVVSRRWVMEEKTLSLG